MQFLYEIAEHLLLTFIKGCVRVYVWPRLDPALLLGSESCQPSYPTLGSLSHSYMRKAESPDPFFGFSIAAKTFPPGALNRRSIDNYCNVRIIGQRL
jgi:hypothetical protein